MCHVIHIFIHSEVSVGIFIMGTNIHYKIQKFPVVCGSRARAWLGAWLGAFLGGPEFPRPFLWVKIGDPGKHRYNHVICVYMYIYMIIYTYI